MALWEFSFQARFRHGLRIGSHEGPRHVVRGTNRLAPLVGPGQLLGRLSCLGAMRLDSHARTGLTGQGK
eukprot:scaffold624_cov402-Prasinococcus_capsulatus_cf.AAC.54